MTQVVTRLLLLAGIATFPVPATSFAASADATGTSTELAANFLQKFFQTNRYQHLVCIYSQGSQLHQCDVTQTGPEYQVGMPCYCGNGLPKGIIRSTPLTVAPN